MQSRRRMRSSLLSVLTGSAQEKLFVGFFLFISFVVAKVLVTCQASVLLPSQRYHLCVPLWHSDCCVLPSSFPFPPSPSLSSSSSSRSSRHCLALYHLLRLNWAGSISTETCGDFLGRETRGKKERELLFLRTYPPLLAAGVFPLLFSFFSSFFSYFWWTGHRSGRKDCSCHWRVKEGSWCRTPAFRNARSGLRMVSPATPSFACFIPPSVPANCVSPPFHLMLHLLLDQSLLQVCLLSDLTAGAAVSATGSNDVCTDMGLTGGAQESNLSPWNDAFVKGLHSNDNVGSRTCESTRVR